MCKKALIFDMDGVIADTAPLHEEAWMQFCSNHQIQITSQQFREELFGRSNKSTLKILLGKDLSKTDFHALSNEKEKLYRKLATNQLLPLNGLVNFLQAAKKQNFKIAIASSAHLENIIFTLDQTATSQFFNCITSSEEIDNSKPHPEIFLKTALKLNVSPENCFVFEDSFPGIESARKAEMKVVGLATTHSIETLPRTDLSIVDFSEIDLRKIKYLFG